MKRIALATFTRAEYGSIAPVMRALDATGEFETQLIVSGAHLSPWHGNTVETICADGFPIAERVEMQLASDTPEGVSKSIGLAMAGFAQAMARLRPELLLLAGDRTELIAPATVALLSGIPVAHLSGGEITEGAIDNQVRHAVSKMSHLHFVCMAENARRLCQMGEDPSRVHVTGDPALDAIKRMRLLSRDEPSSSLDMSLGGLLVCRDDLPSDDPGRGGRRGRRSRPFWTDWGSWAAR